MFAVLASYRGRSRRRSDLIRDVATRLARFPRVDEVERVGIEDIVCLASDPEGAGSLVMALLQAGDFAISIAALAGQEDYIARQLDAALGSDGVDDALDLADVGAEADVENDVLAEVHEQLRAAAQRVMSPRVKAGQVVVTIEQPGHDGVVMPGEAQFVAEDIASAFTLVAFVLSRRTEEGREATALLRAGYRQSEAAVELGISKQAMSQRLLAAGWKAEQAGWRLAIHMLERVQELRDRPDAGPLR